MEIPKFSLSKENVNRIALSAMLLISQVGCGDGWGVVDVSAADSDNLPKKSHAQNDINYVSNQFATEYRNRETGFLEIDLTNNSGIVSQKAGVVCYDGQNGSIDFRPNTGTIIDKSCELPGNPYIQDRTLFVPGQVDLAGK